MSKNVKKDWGLDPKEVECGLYGSSSGKHGQLQRKVKITSSTVFLIHTPTDTRIEGEVPPGHYSKKEMQKKREELFVDLFPKLEKMVAKKLKIKDR